jgi:hypothetical protein
MFKKLNFYIEEEEPDKLQAFKNIRKLGIFRVETHPTVFPCIDSILWILKNIDINSRYVCNARKEPISSFRQEFLSKCYHIEEGNKRMDRKILSEFEYTLKDLFPKWYKVDKQFKYRPKIRYPMTNLRSPYHYLVAMMCMLYGETNTTQFSLSYMPLIYLCADVGVSFNWENILSKNLTASISTVTQEKPKTFPSFHMSSYLLDIMCTTHRYPNIGWSWLSSNTSIHIYCKVLWEHKYCTKYQRICEHFLDHLYEFIFCTTPPCMIEKSIEVIRRIGDWYLMKHGTYIRDMVQ